MSVCVCVCVCVCVFVYVWSGGGCDCAHATLDYYKYVNGWWEPRWENVLKPKTDPSAITPESSFSGMCACVRAFVFHCARMHPRMCECIFFHVRARLYARNSVRY